MTLTRAIACEGGGECSGEIPCDVIVSKDSRKLISLRSKHSFSTKRAWKRFSANWPRGSWGKRLRERLQEDPLFLKNAHVFMVDLTHAD